MKISCKGASNSKNNKCIQNTCSCQLKSSEQTKKKKAALCPSVFKMIGRTLALFKVASDEMCTTL